MGHEFHRILYIKTAHVFEGNFKPQLQVFEFYFNGNIISSEKSLSHPFSHPEKCIHHFLLACNLLETCAVVLGYQFIQSTYRLNKLKT